MLEMQPPVQFEVSLLYIVYNAIWKERDSEVSTIAVREYSLVGFAG